jgi:hypothetical protein
MRIALMTWLFALALPVAAHAQSAGTGSIDTGSGTETVTARIMLQEVLDIAPKRVARSLKQLAVPAKQQDAWEAESVMTRQRMAEQRAECRDIIRKSNRDERMPRMLQCQRAMLLLETNLLRKEATYFNAIPLLDPTVKATATGSIAKLEDAMMAIVDGIDTGLFSSEQQLLTARDNLRITYRTPYWQAKAALHQDRELTYSLFIAKSLFERSDLDAPELLPPASCIHAVVMQYRLGPPVSGRNEASVCRPLISNLAKADRQQEKN